MPLGPNNGSADKKVKTWSDAEGREVLAAASDLAFPYASLAITSPTTTLSAEQGSSGILSLTGTLAANSSAIFPTAQKAWIVENATSGAYDLTVKTASGAGVKVRRGAVATIYSNGTDIKQSGSSFGGAFMDARSTSPQEFAYPGEPLIGHGTTPTGGFNGTSNWVGQYFTSVAKPGGHFSLVSEMRVTNALSGTVPSGHNYGDYKAAGGFFTGNQAGNTTNATLYACTFVTEHNTGTDVPVYTVEINPTNYNSDAAAWPTWGTNEKVGLQILSGGTKRNHYGLLINSYYTTTKFNTAIKIPFTGITYSGIEIGDFYPTARGLSEPLRGALTGRQMGQDPFINALRWNDASASGNFIRFGTETNSSDIFTLSDQGDLFTQGKLNLGGVATINSTTGILTGRQITNGGDVMLFKRQTDSSPTGYLLRLRNEADNTNIFSISATGVITFADGTTQSTAAGSGSVSGSGTTGKLSKWSSTSALTDSNLAESGGNLNHTSDGGGIFTGPASGVTTRLFAASASARGYVGTYTNHSFVVRTYDTDRTVWDTTGKLTNAGIIESTSGGFKFPDGTTQTTAAEITSPSFSGASLTNSWVNYDTSTYHAAGYMIHEGIVYLRGLIKNGTVGATAFTLPSGYRPSRVLLFPVISGGTLGRVDVNSAGDVVVVSGSNSYLSLEGIFFQAS